MDKFIKINILGDGNCLFRCFSFFLYNTEKFHMQIRLNTVRYIVAHWDSYSSFIIGNTYYGNIFNSVDYEQYMSQISIYGSDVEIVCFSEIYNANVQVHSAHDQNDVFSGMSFQPFKLVLLFSGELDAGHYDILDFNNDDIKSYITNLKKKRYTLKQKISRNNIPKACLTNINNKKHTLKRKISRTNSINMPKKNLKLLNFVTNILMKVLLIHLILVK